MTKPPFTQDELLQGKATFLRTVATPKVGETVEVGYIITDLVLCLNKAVEEIESLKEQLKSQGGAIKFEKTEEFTLPSVATDYKDA